MAEANERRRVLDMLAAGQISAEQAHELLSAVDAGPAASAERPRRQCRSLRIEVEADEDGARHPARAVVHVPLGLAKFAAKFLPEGARLQLQDQGIELTELLQALDQETPEGRLLDIEAGDGEQGPRARVIVEVV